MKTQIRFCKVFGFRNHNILYRIIKENLYEIGIRRFHKNFNKEF